MRATDGETEDALDGAERLRRVSAQEEAKIPRLIAQLHSQLDRQIAMCGGNRSVRKRAAKLRKLIDATEQKMRKEFADLKKNGPLDDFDFETGTSKSVQQEAAAMLADLMQ